MKPNSKRVKEEIKEILFTQKNTYSVLQMKTVKNEGTNAFLVTITIAFVVTAVLTHFGIISLY